jgi:hypothetical protein
MMRSEGARYPLNVHDDDTRMVLHHITLHILMKAKQVSQQGLETNYGCRMNALVEVAG